MSLFHKIENNQVQFNILPSIRFVITGLTRGGTNFIHNVLKRLEIPTSHEGFFGSDGARPVDNLPRFNPECEVSGLMAPYVAEIKRQYPSIKVFHLIRNPVDCIASNLNYFPQVGKEGWETMEDVWLRWHRLNAKYSDTCIRLENWWDDLPMALSLVGHRKSGGESLRQACSTVERGRSTPGAGKHFEDLKRETQEFARTYGYGT